MELGSLAELSMPLSPTDLHFIEHCQVVKKGSHDPTRQVGVVIASPRGHLLATGTNRPPIGIDLTQEESARAIAKNGDWKYFVLEHAERNAINNARDLGYILTGATMYGTLFPCADCARAIAAARIKRLVVPAPTSSSPSDKKWQQHFFYSLEILKMASIAVDLYLQNPVDGSIASVNNIDPNKRRTLT